MSSYFCFQPNIQIMIFKRIFAYVIDYLLIMLYAVLLFLISYSIHSINDSTMKVQDPLTGNITSFIFITLPVFIYFYLYESSKRQGTFGKQLQKIKVQNNSKRNVFIRVFMKVLPWEIAHFGIHWSFYYDSQNLEIPLWNWVVNIIPQIVVILYFISIVMSKGKSSVYDKIANTSISHVE